MLTGTEHSARRSAQRRTCLRVALAASTLGDGGSGVGRRPRASSVGGSSGTITLRLLGASGASPVRAQSRRMACRWGTVPIQLQVNSSDGALRDGGSAGRVVGGVSR
jgi:hypothetical protein